MRRTSTLLTVLLVSIVAAFTAQGGSASSGVCGVQAYSYAGVQASSAADGVAAQLAATAAPSVSDGHVGGWIGVGGATAGPQGQAEWLQVGLAAFPGSETMQMYYEVTQIGSQPRYVELESSVPSGVSTHFAVLEMAHRSGWWRVWVDDKPVSPPIYLPGSNGTWYPQAMAENWNGGVDACNAYSYRFSDVRLAAGAGKWQPMGIGYEFNDPGYAVVPVSSSPVAFLATSLSV